MRKLSFYLLFSLLCFTLFSFNSLADINVKYCGNNEKARELALLISSDYEQQRKHLRCNKVLSEVALAKAKLMAEYGLVTHNLGGSPNGQLEKANYQLPEYYGTSFNSNQVEAIAGGYESAERVWSAFKRSAGHRMHLLGEHDFYLEQDEIGVAFVREWETPHVEYWVVYLTKGASQNQVKYSGEGEIPNKSIYILLESDATQATFLPEGAEKD